MRKLPIILCFLTLCVGLTQPIQAQNLPAQNEEILSDTKGFFLQGHLQGNGLAVKEEDADSGSGFGIKVGYGFSRFFTLYLGIDAASMEVVADPGTQGGVADEYALAYVDLGGRVNFRSGPNSFVPYLDGALSGIGAVYETNVGDAAYSGAGLSLGGGLQYFISQKFALNSGLHLTFGEYNELEIAGQTENVSLDVTGARLKIGFSWYPF